MSSVLTVSAFGLVLLRRPEPVPVSIAVVDAQPVFPETICRTEIVPAPQESVLKAVSKEAEDPVAEPAEVAPVVEVAVETPFFEPVQTLDERGDAVLFEAQALMDTPFDQSITMPFDNL